jgi:hypothetical protein
MNNDISRWKNLIVEADNEPQPKKQAAPQAKAQTKAKQKSPVDDINLNRDEFYPDVAKPKNKADINLNVASQQASADAVKNVKMDSTSLAHLLSLMLNVDEDELDQDVGFIDITKPTVNLLPKVMSKALLAAGQVNPEFHMVKHLPGYMSKAIRMVGRAVFAPFTKTPIENIQVIANVNGSGPNSDRELNAVANFLKKHGTRQAWSDDAEIQFNDLMPGYKAKTVIRSFANYTFAVVIDHAGKYIYAWPSTDSKQSITDKSVDNLLESYSTLHAKDTEKIEPKLEDNNDPTDKVCVDIPLLIRLMEYAREDAKDDEALHRVAERCIKKSKHKDNLTMADYDSIVADDAPPKKAYTESKNKTSP